MPRQRKSLGMEVANKTFVVSPQIVSEPLARLELATYYLRNSCSTN